MGGGGQVAVYSPADSGPGPGRIVAVTAAGGVFRSADRDGGGSAVTFVRVVSLPAAPLAMHGGCASREIARFRVEGRLLLFPIPHGRGEEGKG